MALCLTDDMDKLVQKSKAASWPEAKRKWFVMDNSNAKDLRFPGKMKLEWSTSFGAIAAYVYFSLHYLDDTFIKQDLHLDNSLTIKCLVLA